MNLPTAIRQARWCFAQFLEIHWWKRYFAHQNRTAYLAWKKAYWEDFLQTAGLEIPADATALDAGCGPAGIFTILSRQRVEALDPLFDAYARRLPHFFQPTDYPWVQFFNTPLEAFAPDRRYDWVFCLNAVNHVADLPACLDRLGALTHPDGRLILSVDAHKFQFLKKLFRLLPGDALHPQQHDLADYQAMLTARGYLLEKTILLKKGTIFNYWLLMGRPERQ